MGDWAMIGVPSSAGAHHAGQERAPDALRAAGLAGRLTAAGESVQDLGNLPEAPFAVDHRHPGARNLDAVARVAREVADAVADVAGTGRLPAGPKHWMQAGGDQRFGHQCFFVQFFQGLGDSRAIILRLASGVIALSHIRNRTVTCGS